MNYHKYYTLDIMNGVGTRCTLFLAGCEHHCNGCYNQSTWNPNSGHKFTQELEDEIIKDLNNTVVPRRGLSLSGGDPLHPANIAGVLKLLSRVKSECPDKDIWVWTGYRLSDIIGKPQMMVVDLADVLVDGKFEKRLVDPSLVWRGSSNQIVYDFRVLGRDYHEIVKSVEAISLSNTMTLDLGIKRISINDKPFDVVEMDKGGITVSDGKELHHFLINKDQLLMVKSGGTVNIDNNWFRRPRF